MNRVEVDLAIHRKHVWLVETYSAFEPETLEAPCTQDEHDPTCWWTLKDHFAHCSHITKTRMLVAKEFVSGAENPFLMMDGTRVDFQNTPFPDIIKVVHANTHKVWREYHDKSFSELVALGQRTLSETLGLLGSITDEQIESKIPGSPWGDGTLGSMLAGQDHERDHLRFALQGLAANAGLKAAV